MLQLEEYKTFDFIRKETSFSLKSTLHTYVRYCEEHGSIQDVVDFAENVGQRYFIFDICSDEIMEMFSEAVCNRNYNSLTDSYSFITFLFKKALFNEQITVEEAKTIYRKYIGTEQYDNYNRLMSSPKPTKFVLELTSYKHGKSSEEVEEYVYNTMYEFVQDLGY